MQTASLPPSPPAIEMIHVGGPTVVMNIGGFRIVTDPTFDPGGGEYASGTVQLKKHTGPAIPANELGRVNLVLLSHDQHADNLDHEGRKLLQSADRAFTTIEGATRLGSIATGLRPWESRVLKLPGGKHLRITATPARHGPPGAEKILGPVIGFVLTLVESRQDLVYITGDTVWFDGLAKVARRFRPKYVLLFAGAAQTRGPFHLTMNVNDALETSAAFPEATLIPVHCEGWEHFKQSASSLEEGFTKFGHRDRLLIPDAGKTLKLY